MEVVEEGLGVAYVTELLAVDVILSPDAVVPVHALGQKAIGAVVVLGRCPEDGQGVA